MANVVARLARSLARLPGRLLRATQPTTGDFPIDSGGRYTDLDEIEGQRRREREKLRRGVE